MARPLEYNPSYVEKAENYLANCVDKYEEFHKTRGAKSDGYDRLVRVNLPTIEGLAMELDIARSTLYLWKEEYAEFSDIIDKVMEKQANMLIQSGLSGDYNPTIAKVLLTKHGYRDAIDTDITTKGEKILDSEKVKELEDKFNAFIKRDNTSNTA